MGACAMKERLGNQSLNVATSSVNADRMCRCRDGLEIQFRIFLVLWLLFEVLLLSTLLLLIEV